MNDLSDTATPAEQLIHLQKQLDEAQRPMGLPGSSDGLEFHGDIDALFTKLAEATPQFGDVTKTKAGQIGHQHFKYATLAMLREATSGALSKCGISCPQFIIDTPDPGLQQVVTMLIGHGGRAISRMTYQRPGDPAEMGKVSTYMRRYTLTAILGVDGGEDMDNPPKKEEAKPQAEKRPDGNARQRQAPAARASKTTDAKKAEHEAKAQAKAAAKAETKAKAGEVDPPGRDQPEVKAAVVMMTDQQKEDLRSICIEKGKRGPQLAELSQEHGGAAPGELTLEGADKLLTHLRTL